MDTQETTAPVVVKLEDNFNPSEKPLLVTVGFAGCIFSGVTMNRAEEQGTATLVFPPRIKLELEEGIELSVKVDGKFEVPVTVKGMSATTAPTTEPEQPQAVPPATPTTEARLNGGLKQSSTTQPTWPQVCMAFAEALILWAPGNRNMQSGNTPIPGAGTYHYRYGALFQVNVQGNH